MIQNSTATNLERKNFDKSNFARKRIFEDNTYLLSQAALLRLNIIDFEKRSNKFQQKSITETLSDLNYE